MGSDHGIVQKKGSHYTYGNMKLGNGRVAACEVLNANADMLDEIERQVLSKLAARGSGTEDKEEPFDQEE